jgi:hypothetical protein
MASHNSVTMVADQHMREGALDDFRAEEHNRHSKHQKQAAEHMEHIEQLETDTVSTLMAKQHFTRDLPKSLFARSSII